MTGGFNGVVCGFAGLMHALQAQPTNGGSLGMSERLEIMLICVSHA